MKRDMRQERGKERIETSAQFFFFSGGEGWAGVLILGCNYHMSAGKRIFYLEYKFHLIITYLR